MKSKERVRKVFAHLEPDTVPVFEQEIASNIASQMLGRYTYTGQGGVGWRDVEELTFQGRRDFLVERMVKDLIEIHEKLDMDIVRVPLVPEKNAKGPEKKLDKYTYYYEDEDSGAWWVRRYEPSSMMFSLIDSSFRRNGLLSVEKYARSLEDKEVSVEKSSFEAMEAIVERMSDEKAITVSSSIGIPFEASWLRALYEKPRIVEIYLNYIVRREIFLISKYKKIGVDFILGGGDIACNNGPFFSPSVFRKVFLPKLRKIVDFCHGLGLPYMYRTDGNIWLIANELLVESGVDGYGEIDAQAGMRLGELKKSFPNLVLWGNIDCAKTLVFGSREQVVEETIRAIREAAPGGGYILGSSNTIHPTVKLENFMTMLETARAYGKYPIRL